MAIGRWNHTADNVAAVVNLSKLVTGMFGKDPVKLIAPIDVHPYRRRTKRQELDRQFAQQMAKIAALPYAERKAARAELQKEYAEELKAS